MIDDSEFESAGPLCSTGRLHRGTGATKRAFAVMYVLMKSIMSSLKQSSARTNELEEHL